MVASLKVSKFWEILFVIAGVKKEQEINKYSARK
jgi:hypothetical protein